MDITSVNKSDVESENGYEDYMPVTQNFTEYHHLPDSIKRRVLALKNLQLKTITVDAEFYKKLYELEKEFEARHQEIFDSRKAIVQGKHEPTDEEANFTEKPIDMEDLESEIKKMSVGDIPSADAKGIPDFWYKALRHVPQIENMIFEDDIPILKHLIDIKCVMSPTASPGFTLEFYFSANDYFGNQKLAKQYFFSYEIPKDEPFDYSGPEIVACQGDIIDWNKGKDVTVKQEKKVQKHKGRGEKRVVYKNVKADSFFNFFNPEKLSMEDADDETVVFLDLDFKIGQFIHETLIPRAVLYYTGEDYEDIDDSDDESDDDDDCCSSDQEEEDDDEEDASGQKAAHAHKRSHNKRKHRGGAKPAAENEECKQQ